MCDLLIDHWSNLMQAPTSYHSDSGWIIFFKIIKNYFIIKKKYLTINLGQIERALKLYLYLF
jgi:hypothetical protein